MEKTVEIIKKQATPEDLERLEEGSALTMTGYLVEELHLYVKAISGYVKADTVNVFMYTSEALNAARGTTLPTGLNMFSIDLEELDNIPQLAVRERMQYGFRWLDDICDNNRRAEEE